MIGVDVPWWRGFAAPEAVVWLPSGAGYLRRWQAARRQAALDQVVRRFCAAAVAWCEISAERIATIEALAVATDLARDER